MKKQNQAFTLVELIVVITILAILGTIAFISLQGYSKKARDSKRTSDIANIKVSLELFSLNTGYYPTPDNGEIVEYDGDLLWTQGTVGTNVTTNLSRNLHKKPTDPLHDIEYIYSLASSNKEYELMSVHEGDLVNNSLVNSTYALDKYSVKVGGNYNALFVKTANHIFPVPSLITSATIPLDFDLEPSAIESQVITGGNNFPGLSIPNTQTQTGALKMTLSVYSGTPITFNSSDSDKILAMQKIQLAYSGSELANEDIYAMVINTAVNDLPALVDDVVLDNNTSNNIVNTSCDGISSGETKDFWSTGNVTYAEGQTECDSQKKTFICDNTVWKEEGVDADTTTYSFDSCTVGDAVNCESGTIVGTTYPSITYTYGNIGDLNTDTGSVTETKSSIINNYSATITCNNGNASISDESNNPSCPSGGYTLNGTICERSLISENNKQLGTDDAGWGNACYGTIYARCSSNEYISAVTTGGASNGYTWNSYWYKLGITTYQGTGSNSCAWENNDGYVSSQASSSGINHTYTNSNTSIDGIALTGGVSSSNSYKPCSTWGYEATRGYRSGNMSTASVGSTSSGYYCPGYGGMGFSAGTGYTGYTGWNGVTINYTIKCALK